VGGTDDPRSGSADERFRLAFEAMQKLIGLVDDPTERQHLEEHLRELALVDDVTGLHNRRSFILLAQQAIKESFRARRPVLARFVVVDGVNNIQDQHGHAEGDRALRLVADGLRSACRSSDIIGRLHGDEFAVLLSEAHEMDGLEDRIRRCVADAAAVLPYRLSVSIGAARCAAGEACSLTDLFDRADQAMYAEKAAKRR
jgi:diguanylate cyclase (GGDEF)-like protein